MLALLEILGFMLEFLFGLAELIGGLMEYQKKRVSRRMKVGKYVDEQES